MRGGGQISIGRKVEDRLQSFSSLRVEQDFDLITVDYWISCRYNLGVSNFCSEMSLFLCHFIQTIWMKVSND